MKKAASMCQSVLLAVAVLVAWPALAFAQPPPSNDSDAKARIEDLERELARMKAELAAVKARVDAPVTPPRSEARPWAKVLEPRLRSLEIIWATLSIALRDRARHSAPHVTGTVFVSSLCQSALDDRMITKASALPVGPNQALNRFSEQVAGERVRNALPGYSPHSPGEFR
jgi:hypothetical protein